MEKARAVLRRLERIDAMRRDEAPAPALLDEVRSLLAEAEEWVREEPEVSARARGALDRCRDALAAGELSAEAALSVR